MKIQNLPQSGAFAKTAAVILIILFTANLTGAQSDYEKVQNFKTRYNQIEDSIKTADGYDDCFAIENEIIKLKGDFAGDKQLLDKSLYPLDFNGAIDKLAADLETRRGDISEISYLQEEVTGLKERLTFLDRQNVALLEQIKDMEDGRKKDAATIESLQKLTAQLKSNLRKKEELVVVMIDSLLAEFVNHPFTLNEAERLSFDRKIEYNNLFYNLDRTISDNIEFLKVTRLQADDLSDLKEKYNRFSKMWKQIGPKLAEVYLNREDRTASIERIDSKFIRWEYEINAHIWRNINALFKKENIKLSAYNNGEEFTNRLTAFIEDEIKNIGIKKSSESENIYYTFTDTLWFGKIRPDWIPMLIENKMFEEAQKDTIENRIANWKAKVVQDETPVWPYIVGVVILIILGAALVFRKKK